MGSAAHDADPVPTEEVADVEVVEESTETEEN